jgi:hypothetical protein
MIHLRIVSNECGSTICNVFSCDQAIEPCR